MPQMGGGEPAVTSSGVLFWGWDAAGYGQGVTFPGEIAELAATDYQLYCRFRDGTVTLVAGGWAYPEFQVPPEATNVVALSAGGSHMLALRGDGRVAAWGAPTHVFRNLILAVPSDLTNAVAIAAGGDHSLALRADGTVVSWGYDAFDGIRVPEGLSNVVALAAGGGYSMAVKRDGTVVDWGDAARYGDPLAHLDLTNVTALALGHYGSHGLALRPDGTVVGWQGPDLQAIEEWTVPPGLSNVVSISAGPVQCYAVRADGSLAVWGWNKYGQTNVPVDLRGVTQAAGGYALAAAVTQAPMILAPPVNDAVAAGSDAEFTVRLLNERNAQIQWRLNEVVIPEATNALLRLTNAQANHAGAYEVTVGSAAWREVKASATLQVRPAVPWWFEIPQDRSVRPGESIQFQCLARGTEPISYTWLRDGQPIDNATHPTLTLPFVTPRDGGYYTVFAQNQVGASPWAVAFLSVLSSGEFLSPRLDADGAFSFRLTVDSGRAYRVQISQDLMSWEEWLGFVSIEGGVGFQDLRAANGVRFYRLVSP